MGLLLATFLGASSLQANFAPAAWQSAPLEVAAGTSNNWYFYPDDLGNPRVLAKATTSNNTPARRLLTGGPPAWTVGLSASMGQINKQGVFVPSPGGGGFFIAPHNQANLKVAIFDSTGGFTLETIDPNPGLYTGISAELDSSGILHVGYVADNSIICYARRTSFGDWIFRGDNLGTASVIHDTAVVPTTTSDVNLYYSATASNVTSLWRAKPGIVSNTLYIFWGANPLTKREDFVGRTLRGSRVGPVGRLFYFGKNSISSTSWIFKRTDNFGNGSDLETAGNVSPKSIHTAFGPDGKQRVAWYNETTKKIHYLRPAAAGVDVPVLAGQPVSLSGNPANPDLLGFHFGPDGTPYLLYRTTNAAAFIAFPNDHFDTNGNGRPQILDTAFNSNSAGLEVLPVKATFPGVANSANRFKIRFPTIGNASTNGVGGIQTAAENLLYTVEVSSDLGTWTPLSPGSAITYTNTAISGSVRTYVGVINDPAPGPFPTRFARLNVSRLNYPY